MSEKKIKVFIVEDSILMQKIIYDILSNDSHIEVIGMTKFAKEALKKIPELLPDIVTLDVNLPDMNGLLLLQKLMSACPVKVVMLSAYTQKGEEITMKALELGALDFIPKPSGEVSLDLYNFKDEIISKIKLIADVDLQKAITITHKETVQRFRRTEIVDKIVIIGASTGGPRAIIDVMSHIPNDPGASFLIIQHMPKGFTKSFSQRVAWHSPVKTKETEDGETVINNAAYVACAGFHMILERSLRQRSVYHFRLDETPLVNYVRPAIDVTMKSAAKVFEGKIIGVILTGMGEDGVRGAKAIKERGGKIIVQNEESCVVYGMPKAVVTSGLADDILALSDIPKKIREYLKDD